MTKYKVTCLDCKETDVHTIDDTNHLVTFSEKVLKTNIVGTRWRKDNVMGFHCRCGNWNLLGSAEEDVFDKYVAGDGLTIKKYLASLLVPDNEQFRLEKI